MMAKEITRTFNARAIELFLKWYITKDTRIEHIRNGNKN